MFPSLDAAIGKFEGFGVPGTIATRNNNPGDIVAGAYATAHGATGSNSGFATFPDVATGLAAQDALIGSYANRGATLDEMITAWNGNGPNTGAYSTFVQNQAGVSGQNPVSSMGGITTTVNGMPATDPNAMGNILGGASLALGALSGIPGLGVASGVAGLAGAVAGQGSSAVMGGSFFGISWSRIVAVVLGVACVIIGLVSLSSGQSVTEVIVSGSKHAGEAIAAA